MKSELLYNEIDRNTLFFGTANREDRSQMNATFRLVDNKLKNRFENLCKKASLSSNSKSENQDCYSVRMKLW